jgi:hypothetical protein
VVFTLFCHLSATFYRFGTTLFEFFILLRCLFCSNCMIGFDLLQLQPMTWLQCYECSGMNIKVIGHLTYLEVLRIYGCPMLRLHVLNNFFVLFVEIKFMIVPVFLNSVKKLTFSLGIFRFILMTDCNFYICLSVYDLFCVDFVFRFW